MAKRVYRRSVNVVRYFLGLDGQTFAFIAKILGLLIYLYWVSVGLIYESTKFNKYGVNLFEFAVVEDIAFVTAKTWFLFFMPFVIPLVVCLVISIFLFVVALILVQLGKSLRAHEKTTMRPWKTYDGIWFPPVPRWKKIDQDESSSDSITFKKSILMVKAIASHISNWMYFTLRCILIVLFLGILLVIEAGKFLAINFTIFVLKLLDYLKYYFTRWARKVLLTSARAAAIVAYVLVGVTLISPQIVAYLIADRDILGDKVGGAVGPLTPETMEGKMCRIAPPACIEDVKHIGSTRNYAMFLLRSRDEKGAAQGEGEAGFSNEVIVVPRGNLSSFENSEKSPPATPPNGKKEVEERRGWIPVAVGHGGTTDVRLIDGAIKANTSSLKALSDSVVAVGKSVEAIAEMNAEGLRALGKTVETGTRTNARGLEALSDSMKAILDSVASVGTSLEASAETNTEGLEALGKTVETSAEMSAMGLETLSESVGAVSGAVAAVAKSVDASAKTNARGLEALGAAVETNAEGLEALGRTVKTSAEMSAKGLETLSGSVNAVSGAVAAIGKSVEASAEINAESLEALTAVVETGARTSAQGLAALAAAIETNAEANAASLAALAATVGTNTEMSAKGLETLLGSVKASAETNAEGLKVLSVSVAGIGKSVEASAETNAESLAALAMTVEANAKANAEGLAALGAAVETGAKTNEQGMVALSNSMEAVAASVAAVGKTAETGAAVLASVSKAVASVEEATDKVPGRILQFPVRQYEVVDGSRGKTIYTVSTYLTGQYRLGSEQRDWLRGFFASLSNCGTDNPPKILLSGFASSQNYERRTEPTIHNNLCRISDHKDTSRMSSEERSDFNNCYLAVERAAEVASFLKHIDKDSGQKGDENYRDLFAGTMQEMDNYCSQDTTGILPSVVPNIRIEPWCEAKDMAWKRSRTFGLDHGQDGRFHILNRSVHLEIQDPGNCSTLSNLSDTSQ